MQSKLDETVFDVAAVPFSFRLPLFQSAESTVEHDVFLSERRAL